jgi:hypothetical protein
VENDPCGCACGRELELALKNESVVAAAYPTFLRGARKKLIPMGLQ